MIKRALAYTFLVLGCLIANVPFAITTLASLKTMPEIVQDVLALPPTPAWGNYAEAWEQGRFSRFFLNSTVVAIAVVIPSVVFSSMTGYAFARFRFLSLIHISEPTRRTPISYAV